MAAGFHVARDTVFHRLHPVTRIVLTALAFAAALVLDHPVPLAGLFALFLVASAGTGVFSGLRRVWWLLALIGLASFGIWSVALDGETAVVALGPFQVTREGMIHGAAMGLRLDLMIFSGLVFLTVTPVEDFNHGLTSMGVPFAVSFALTLSFRLAPLFSNTLRTIQDAQRARGLDPSAGGPLARMRNFVPLLAPVFMSSLRRSDQLAAALESKGFGLGRPRGSFKQHRFGAADVMLLAFMVLLVTGLSALRFRGVSYF